MAWYTDQSVSQGPVIAGFWAPGDMKVFGFTYIEFRIYGFPLYLQAGSFAFYWQIKIFNNLL